MPGLLRKYLLHWKCQRARNNWFICVVPKTEHNTEGKRWFKDQHIDSNYKKCPRFKKHYYLVHQCQQPIRNLRILIFYKNVYKTWVSWKNQDSHIQDWLLPCDEQEKNTCRFDIFICFVTTKIKKYHVYMLSTIIKNAISTHKASSVSLSQK